MQNAAHARYAPRTTAAYKASRAAGRVDAGGVKKDSPYIEKLDSATPRDGSRDRHIGVVRDGARALLAAAGGS